MATRRLSNIRYADQFIGVNAGQKIAAAIADLPTTGGIVDALAFEGDQQITSNMFAAVPFNLPLTLLMSPANFKTSVTQIYKGQGLNFICNSSPGDSIVSTHLGTRFTWDGANGGTCFLIDGTRDSTFKGFSVVPGTGTIGIGIRVDTTVFGFVVTNNKFKNISIGIATAGIQIGTVAGQGNDLHIFEDIYLIEGGTYGYQIQSGQAKGIKIIRGAISARTNGIYCSAGSFHAEYVTFGNNTNDIAMGGTDAVLIKGCQSEGANKFLKAIGPTGVSYYSPLTIENCRCATNNVGVDNIYLQYYAIGPLVLMNNQFTDGGHHPNFKVDFQSAAGVQVISKGNTWWDTKPFTGTPNDTQMMISSDGDLGMTASGQAVQMPRLDGGALGYGGDTMTLVNGDNNDIPINPTGTGGSVYAPNYFKVGGPTGSFAITGFDASYNGRQIKIFNRTSQQMTIKNLTGSSSVNQIQTLNGANVTLRTGTSFATFIYDLGLAKWLLMSFN